MLIKKLIIFNKNDIIRFLKNYNRTGSEKLSNLVGKEFIDFELPYIGDSGIETYKLSNAIDEHQSIVLAFFPAAWTGGCVKEMCSFRDDLKSFEDLDAKVITISVDLPWAQQHFKKDLKLNFLMVSDVEKKIIKAYDVEWPNFANLGVTVANRAIFVIKSGKIVYQWVGENPGKYPNFDEIKDVLKTAN